jgi:acetate kinase
VPVRVLVVNAGSSSLKLRVVETGTGPTAADDATLVASEDLDVVGGDPEAALARFVDAATPLDAAGHRVVHGGAEFEHALVVDAAADDALGRLADLAPLHNPPALDAIRFLRRLRPQLVQVACFDTSFHAGMPARAATYALPPRWREEWGVRRFGFHGLSHAWACRRAAALLDRNLEETALVTAHIGAGVSLAAVLGGRSIDTTMGFSPLEGLVMATRSGSVDPAAVLLALRRGLDAADVERALEREAGLLGLAGVSDLREVIAGADRGGADAALAYAVYVYRIQTAVGAMAVALGRLDGLVFTGGAGEASPRLRADVCAGLGLLGIARPEEAVSPPGGPWAPGGAGDDLATPQRDTARPEDRVVSAAGARPAVLVVEAREDLEILREVVRLGAGR